MIASILGKKLGMSQIFKDGKRIPVTVIAAGPCTVLQAKKLETDGYFALQLGFDAKKKKQASKAEIGHAEKRAQTGPKRFVKEIEWDGKGDVKEGESINVSVMEKFRYVDVTGTSKGKGFQGGVRRYGFGGGPKTHGQSDRMRAPGSIGASSIPSRVYKGTRMAGHMGNATRTARNLRLVDIDAEQGLIVVMGSVPGPDGGYVIVKKSLKD